MEPDTPLAPHELPQYGSGDFPGDGRRINVNGFSYDCNCPRCNGTGEDLQKSFTDPVQCACAGPVVESV